MSVPSWERNESKVEFIDNARKLYEHTLKYTKKFPKSATFLVTRDIVEFAMIVFKNVISANKIYVKTEGDLAQRRYLLNEVLGNLSSLDAFIPIVKDIYGVQLSDFGWVEWGRLISKEQELVKGVMRSDEKKFTSINAE